MRATLAAIATLCSLFSAAPAFAAGSIEISLKSPRSIALAQTRQTLGTLHFATTGGMVDFRELPIALEWRGVQKNAKVTFQSFDIRNTVTGRTIDLRLVPEKNSSTSIFGVADDFIVDNGDEWVVRMQAGKELKGASVRLRIFTHSRVDHTCKNKSASDPCNLKTDAWAEMLMTGDTAEIRPAQGIDGRWTKMR